MQHSLEDLVLLPAVEARRALAGNDLAFSLLAPVGNYAGRGVLRVLRVKPAGSRIELACGYESYVRLDGPSTQLRTTNA